MHTHKPGGDEGAKGDSQADYPLRVEPDLGAQSRAQHHNPGIMTQPHTKSGTLS